MLITPYQGYGGRKSTAGLRVWSPRPAGECQMLHSPGAARALPRTLSNLPAPLWRRLPDEIGTGGAAAL
jgi:hypothetical protein